MIEQQYIQTDFKWPLYADATLAGLAALFPIPLVDMMIEDRFRRRIPGAVARYHHRSLPTGVAEELNQSQRGWFGTTVLFLAQLPFKLILRLSRKILYFFAIKAATDQLSEYWQRAFLMNYMLNAGHLETPKSAAQARRAMDEVIERSPSPLLSVARVVVANVGVCLARCGVRGAVRIRQPGPSNHGT
ncbi:MAG: hypothetical protein HC876_06980 [Chloroflexaceae bacterium]|nr:hypothetical protein [Chloroflexaceae bacterium]